MSTKPAAAHASALAPSTLIVVGARGAGKSFWAGVLGQSDTRQLAGDVYPRLGLDRVTVAFGYNGFDTGSAVTRRTVEARTQGGGQNGALIFWQAVLLRSALGAINDAEAQESIAAFIEKYKDSEEFEARLRWGGAPLKAPPFPGPTSTWQTEETWSRCEAF